MEGGQDDDHGMDAMRGTLGAEEGMVRLSGAVQGGNGGGDGTMAVQWKGDSVILQPHQQQRQDHSGGPSAFGRI